MNRNIRVTLKNSIVNCLIGISILCIGIRFFASQQTIETYYSSKLFLYIADFQDFFTQRFQISIFLTVLFGVALYILYYLFFNGWASWTVKGSVIRLSKFLVIVFGTFLFFWGLNYQRKPIEALLDFEMVPVERKDLLEELELITLTLIQARQQVDLDSTLLESFVEKEQLPKAFVFEAAQLINEVAKSEGLATRNGISAREVKPAGLLLRFSTAGVYSPFTGECNFDNGLHPLAKPSVLLHEYVHGLGFGDEGTCTFLANMAGIKSTNPIIRYSVLISYWKKLYRAFYRMDQEQASVFKNMLPQTIQFDIEAIRNYSLRYPDIFPTFRNFIYDTFLKSQGIKEGMKNYDQVINLHYSYRKSRPEYTEYFSPTRR